MKYLEKKESGIHIRVCLEVLNLQLKIIWYYKRGHDLKFQCSLTCLHMPANNLQVVAQLELHQLCIFTNLKFCHFQFRVKIIQRALNKIK